METIKENKKFKIGVVNVPVLLVNEIKVIEEEDYVSIFYAINVIEKDKEAMGIVLKEGLKYKGINYNPYDFQSVTEFESKKWYVKKGINVYENTDVKDIKYSENEIFLPKLKSPIYSNSLLKENNKSFERAYWLIVIKEKR